MHITNLRYFWLTSHPYTNIYIKDIKALNRYSNKITASFPVCWFASLSVSSSVRICRSQLCHYRIYLWNGKTVYYLDYIWNSGYDHRPRMLKVCPVRLHHHPSCWELQPTWGSYTRVHTKNTLLLVLNYWAESDRDAQSMHTRRGL